MIQQQQSFKDQMQRFLLVKVNCLSSFFNIINAYTQPCNGLFSRTTRVGQYQKDKPFSLLAEGGPHAPPTGELLGYFIVAMGLFYRKKHVNIEITGLRGTYFKHF